MVSLQAESRRTEGRGMASEMEIDTYVGFASVVDGVDARSDRKGNSEDGAEEHD